MVWELPWLPGKARQPSDAQVWVQISHEGPGVDKALKVLWYTHLMLPPHISSGLSIPLSPMHGSLCLLPRTVVSLNDFHQLKSTFSALLQVLLWVSTGWMWNRSCFDWTSRSPRAVLYSDGVQSFRAKTCLMQALLVVNVKSFLCGNPMAAGNLLLPQTSLPINSF